MSSESKDFQQAYEYGIVFNWQLRDGDVKGFLHRGPMSLSRAYKWMITCPEILKGKFSIVRRAIPKWEVVGDI